MRFEWLGRCSAIKWLQDGCFYFKVPLCIEVLPHSVHKPGSFHEGITDLGIDHQVNVAHAVALLRIGKRIVQMDIPLLIFSFLYNGQRP